ncbi:MAG: hypothetical protein UW95_C0003G0023 [Parcubacteria group bacterium GW2011_GWC1_45_14]|nr:MAG: hypothetical protein UW87_C0002G0010 [Candidatus Moranbacteria bacterium GW2011_GWC2_45_10]KKT95181.1 MAG: hypothetical protein UW95_C0003G0023 [Parcubacteria group bacterium GW2011_GWC1_45_14]
MEFPFNNIVGADEERKKELKENWHQEIEELSKKNESGFAEFKQQLTAEQREDIGRIEGYVNEIAHRYGAEEKLAPEVILFKPGGVNKATKGRFDDGACSQYRRRIIIDSHPSRVFFATTLAHEMFHLAGYTSLRFSKEKNDMDLYRTGMALESKDGTTSYFKDVEEALIAQAVSMLYDEYLRKDPRFADEIAKTDFIKGWFRKLFETDGGISEKQKEFLDNTHSFPDVNSLIENLNGDESEDYKLGFLSGYVEEMLKKGDVVFRERFQERKKFDFLVDSILENSAGEYADRQKITELFMRAHFSGRLLPLARVIEKSLGKGSFRKVAEDFAEYWDFEKENEAATFKSFNEQDMGELLAKRKAEAEELEKRQKEKMEMLEKAEKDGKLFVK